MDQRDLLNDVIDLISTIVIQLIPIWILVIVGACMEISVNISSFLENMLVFDIVACAGSIIENNGKGEHSGQQYNRLLSVLVVCLASVAYLGILLSGKAIGATVGIRYDKGIYIVLTIVFYQLTGLVMYFSIKNKK